jgi:hypothetical protein
VVKRGREREERRVLGRQLPRGRCGGVTHRGNGHEWGSMGVKLVAASGSPSDSLPRRSARKTPAGGGWCITEVPSATQKRCTGRRGRTCSVCSNCTCSLLTCGRIHTLVVMHHCRGLRRDRDRICTMNFVTIAKVR